MITNAKIVYNYRCVNCCVVEKEMVAVGAFPMCLDCFKLDFPNGDYDTDSEVYKKYLKIRKKEDQS